MIYKNVITCGRIILCVGGTIALGSYRKGVQKGFIGKERTQGADIVQGKWGREGADLVQGRKALRIQT